MKDVTVFDYGSGNVHSAVKAMELAGASTSLSSDITTCIESDGLVVPGVGAFASVVEALVDNGGKKVIESRVKLGRPILGICVGMQVMCEWGLENDEATKGLGIFPGVVEKLSAPRIPHMGWNSVETPVGSKIFAGLEGEMFYFVHSFALKKWESDRVLQEQKPEVTWAQHSQRTVAAVEQGAVTATQFHPEKSGPAGLRLLKNWVGTL